MSGSSLIHVLLLDSQDIERHALSAILERQQDMRLIAEEGDSAALKGFADILAPDVVVFASGFSKREGISILRQISIASPKAKILAVSQHSDSQFVVRMLHAGASGYMLAEGAFEELAPAIRTIISNHTYVSPGIAGITRDRNHNGTPLP